MTIQELKSTARNIQEMTRKTLETIMLYIFVAMGIMFLVLVLSKGHIAAQVAQAVLVEQEKSREFLDDVYRAVGTIIENEKCK